MIGPSFSLTSLSCQISRLITKRLDKVRSFIKSDFYGYRFNHHFDSKMKDLPPYVYIWELDFYPHMKIPITFMN